jgi:hypothetical protein
MFINIGNMVKIISDVVSWNNCNIMGSNNHSTFVNGTIMICQKCKNDADVIITWHHLSIGKLKESLLCSGCCLTMKDSKLYPIDHYSENHVINHRNRNLANISLDNPLRLRRPELFS